MLMMLSLETRPDLPKSGAPHNTTPPWLVSASTLDSYRPTD